MGANRSRKGATAAAAAAQPASAAQDGDGELFVAKTAASAAPPAPGSSSSAPELTVNAKFALAFETRKRQEELTALGRRGRRAEDDDEDSEDSETEDEDGEELTAALDADIRKTLSLIRRRDPAIYDAKIAFFQPQPAAEEAPDRSKKSRSAPLYYKDLVRQQAVAGDVDASDEEEEEPVRTYAEEQAQLRTDFLASLQPESAEQEEQEALDGGLFAVRRKSEGERQQEAADFAAFTTKYGSALGQTAADPEAFLQHYLSSEGWKDKRFDAVPHYEELVQEDDEDAEALERAEEFEHAYNFRFEEQDGAVIQTHARRVDDSLRREDDARKRKRAERKARKALERQKKEEELRRLKNLKQAELQHKLQKVARLMGEGGGLSAEDLEGEFDPEAYDQRMQAVFDEQYYGEDDAEMEEKPTWDEEEDKELFADLPAESEDEQEAQEVAEEEEAEEEPAEAEEGAPQLTSEQMRREKQKYLDELYSLDYEDLIGDLKCRFKYRQVQTNDFGLTAEEIMAADDKELKQLVALKRMAPYAETEYSVDRKRLKNFKKSVRELRREAEEKRRRKPKAVAEAAEGAAEASGKKRRRHKAKKPAAEAPEGEKSAAEAQEGEKPEPEQAKPAERKKRRSKKRKSGEEASFAATGLSTSRLESYKLAKGATGGMAAPPTSVSFSASPRTSRVARGRRVEAAEAPDQTPSESEGPAPKAETRALKWSALRREILPSPALLKVGGKVQHIIEYVG
ncbi:hypothetical protein BBJ28_00019091 [Nothophytophthora sp. Chile5]|nr:hypothetical protein BBJ28_00019091 [Nothophytophthora sp. Chile5]